MLSLYHLTVCLMYTELPSNSVQGYCCDPLFIGTWCYVGPMYANLKLLLYSLLIGTPCYHRILWQLVSCMQSGWRGRICHLLIRFHRPIFFLFRWQVTWIVCNQFCYLCQRKKVTFLFLLHFLFFYPSQTYKWISLKFCTTTWEQKSSTNCM